MEEEISEIKLESSKEIVDPKSSQDIPSPSRRFNFRFGRKQAIIACLLLGLVFVLALTLGLPLIRAYGDGQRAYRSALAIKDAAKSQDIKKTAEAITVTERQLQKVRDDLAPIGWTRIIPFFGSYTSDLFHLTSAGSHGLRAAGVIATAVEPYADLLGLKGQGTFAGGTAEERIAKLVETLDKVTPQIDQIASEVDLMRKDVDAVDPSRYPVSLGGKQIRERLASFKDAVDLIGDLLAQARPMVKQLPVLLGAKEEKKYMVLFQNDAEIRPTGGFITAYAIFRVEKGRIHLETSDDIYKLDDTITRHVAPPEPISKYLNVYGWRLRDSNFSPDFYSSMKTFDDIYASSTDKKKIEGIITMDTHVLVTLMNVLGPINVYGTNFTTNKVPGCDCPMVIYELEKYADEPKSYERGSRKDIIGVLLSEMLRKTLSAPRQIYGPIFQAAFDEAKKKHILLYLHNEDAQKGLEALGLSGRIKSYDGDYLHINDANLGGAKSNLYIKPQVKADIGVNDSGADVDLTVQYRYPHPADNCSLERKEGLCLAGIYRDYLRVYLPPDAKINEVNGFESTNKVYSDLGHEVVAGFFTVVPQGLAKIQLKYHVSGDFKAKGVYRSLIQKQPGTEDIPYAITVNGKANNFPLVEDKELVVKL